MDFWSQAAAEAKCQVEKEFDQDQLVGLHIKFYLGGLCIANTELETIEGRLEELKAALLSGNNFEYFHSEEAVNGERSFRLTKNFICAALSAYGRDVSGEVGNKVPRAVFGPLLLKELEKD